MEIYKFTLDNGLQVVFNRDTNTPIATVSVLYKVGSRDEDPEKTGFAHLFEHLMFEGSKNIKHFDKEVEKVGGTNNAYTTEDYTQYYISLPKENIETALWLESDRMLELDFSAEKLNIQKNVVMEEFKENYINKPYGDDMKLLYAMAYKKHPYRWETIGRCLSHIQKATLKDVKQFFYNFYAPNNAILSIGGDFDPEYIQEIVHKWFDDIPKRKVNKKPLPQEPEQTQRREMTVFREVPQEYIYLAFPYSDRMSPEYYLADLITDILSYGNSSRFVEKLVRKQNLFYDIDAYITGKLDKSLLIIYGSPAPNITLEEAEKIIWQELNNLKNNDISKTELEKFKNIHQMEFLYSQLNITKKTLILAYYQMLGDANLFLNELKKYDSITTEKLKNFANFVFQENKNSILYYRRADLYSKDQQKELTLKNDFDENILNC